MRRSNFIFKPFWKGGRECWYRVTNLGNLKAKVSVPLPRKGRGDIEVFRL